MGISISMRTLKRRLKRMNLKRRVGVNEWPRHIRVVKKIIKVHRYHDMPMRTIACTTRHVYLVIERAHWVWAASWLQTNVAKDHSKIQNSSSQVSYNMQDHIGDFVCIILLIYRRTIMGLLAYLDPHGSLNRESHCLRRRQYIVKVEQTNPICYQANQYYYSNRALMRYGIVMAMTSWCRMGFHCMAVSMGELIIMFMVHDVHVYYIVVQVLQTCHVVEGWYY